MPENVTLRDIAQSAGVSLATVSRALRDDPITAKATRAKVQQVAKEMGYRPDPALQVLIERRWHGRRANEGMNIAFIYDGKSPLAETNRHEYKRFRESALELGYTLIAEDLRSYKNAQKLIQRMRAKGVSAVVFALIEDAHYDLDSICEHFAAVSINVSNWQPTCPVVMHDEFRAIERAWQRLNRAGYERIGVLFHDYPESYSMDQRMGAVFCRQRYTRPARNRIPFLLHEKDGKEEAPKIRKWIEQHQPEVILSDDHEDLWMLESMGYPIPEDFAFTTINMWKKEEIGTIAGHFRDNVILFERGLKLINMMVRSGNSGADQGDLIEMVKGKWGEGITLPHKASLGKARGD